MKAVPIIECVNIPETLRVIAADIESGRIKPKDCTIVMGTEVYHLGAVHPDQMAVNAVWNLNYALHKIMGMALSNEQ